MFRHFQRRLFTNASIGASAAVVAAAAVSISTLSPSNQYSHSETALQPNIPKEITTLRKIDRSVVNLDGYKRVDDLMLQLLSKDHLAKNAVHGTLCGNSLIEVYEIYFNKNKGELLCLVHFGTELNGHPGVVHGGITATVFDNSFGWLFLASKLPVAFTATLNVNYRSKVSEDSTVILRAKVKEHIGRKMFFEATMHDMKGTLLADSTSLFISARAPPKDKAVAAPKNTTPIATSDAKTTVSDSKLPVLSSETIRQQLFVSRGVIS
mmetsp:Transcript_24808/g.41995  ORF Transcript_24808/g.41995 Transcript_24808/m.41995 type:complete len:266 (+) Transcript_24808:32-829(+)